jgi:hypothetical protein
MDRGRRGRLFWMNDGAGIANRAVLMMGYSTSSTPGGVSILLLMVPSGWWSWRTLMMP